MEKANKKGGFFHKKGGFFQRPLISRTCGVLLGLSLGLFVILSSGTCLYAAETGYPDRAVTLVVPLSPGGSVDMIARIFANFAEKILKQPVVVTNKTGGGGSIGGKYVADSTPDGYTLGFFHIGAALPEAYAYFRKAPYSSSDLQPISQLYESTISIAVKEDAPWESFQDFMAYAKANPGVKVGTQGVSSTGWLIMNSVVGKADGVKFVNVPFRGGAKIIAALLGGHVPVGTPAYAGVKPLVEAKKLRTIMVVAEKRMDFAPDVPSLVELGYELPYRSFTGLFGPRGIPSEVVKKMEGLARTIAEDPVFQKKCSDVSNQVSYEDAAAFEKSLQEYNKKLQTMFEEQGLVKK